jgi:hypothetical protein
MCSTLQTNSCNNMPKNIMGYNVFTPAQVSKQVDTQIINSMSMFTTWKMCNLACDKPKWVHIVVRKWTEDKQNASVVGQVNN